MTTDYLISMRLKLGMNIQTIRYLLKTIKSSRELFIYVKHSFMLLLNYWKIFKIGLILFCVSMTVISLLSFTVFGALRDNW